MGIHFLFKTAARLVKIFVAALIVVFCIDPKLIYAQQVSLSIDPPIVQTRIKPGKSILIAYSTENKGDPIALKYTIYSFAPVGRNGGVQLSPLDGPIVFRMENADITFDKPFFFNTKDRKQALIRITVPDTTPEGDYYYMVVAETVPNSPSEGRSSSLASAQLGSPLLITVTENGNSEAQAKIAEFKVDGTYDFTFGKNTYHFVDSSQQLPVTLVIENLGKNVVQPEGSIKVRNGSSVKSYPLLSQNVLKYSERLIKTNPTTNTPSHLSAMLGGFGVGKHTISAEVSYGINSGVQFAQKEVVAVPVRFGLLFLAALAISLILIVFSHKSKKTDKDMS
jgi:hypothetical protein